MMSIITEVRKQAPHPHLKYLVNGMNGTLEEVDKKKSIVAVPFYTRLWQIDASSEWNYDGTETSGNHSKFYSLFNGKSPGDN